MRVEGRRSDLGGADRGEPGARNTKLVKIIVSGKRHQGLHHQGQGITATKGAKSAVESAGGSFEV
jgi:ribosomal protein L15